MKNTAYVVFVGMVSAITATVNVAVISESKLQGNPHLLKWTATGSTIRLPPNGFSKGIQILLLCSGFGYAKYNIAALMPESRASARVSYSYFHDDGPILILVIQRRTRPSYTF